MHKYQAAYSIVGKAMHQKKNACIYKEKLMHNSEKK